MRTMLKLQLPVEAGNDAIQTGRIGQVMETIMGRLQPEAAYFGAENGKRTAYIFFDLNDPSQIPVVSEPLFQSLNASIEFSPVMNVEELQKGLAEAAQG